MTSTSPTGSMRGRCRCRPARFDLDDYIDYLIEICATLSKENDGVPLHTIGVCQPAVPLMAAVALMEAADDPHVPASMTLMGGPIDTRRSPTKVNLLAQERGSRMVPAQLHQHRALRLSRRRAARSIRASCNSPASWR